MSKGCAVVVAVAGIICLICASAFAQGGGMHGTDSSKTEKAAAAPTANVAFTGGPSSEKMYALPPFKAKVNNTVCPVTGNPVNMKDPVTVEYNGKIYNLCCSMCPATFKSEPEKYSKIAEEQAKGIVKPSMQGDNKRRGL